MRLALDFSPPYEPHKNPVSAMSGYRADALVCYVVQLKFQALSASQA